METIRFLPDRLNAEPTVFRGFTTPELGLAALTGFFTGLLWSLPFVPVFGWVIIPTGALLTPLVLVWTGGAWISRLKRGNRITGYGSVLRRKSGAGRGTLRAYQGGPGLVPAPYPCQRG